MNIRLMYELEFLAGIYHREKLQLNNYTVNLSLLTNETDADEINIAMDRIKWFVYVELANTVFMNQNISDRAELMNMLGIDVTVLPEEPVDQIIGMMLYCKLNAIMENRMQVVQLDISSSLGDGVWYMHDEEDALGPFSNEGWWHHPGCQKNNLLDNTQEPNVVKVTPNSWSEAGLNWPDDHQTIANTVVYANFSKNEN